MPVILDPYGYDLWLDPGMTNVAAASELLKPFDARLMRCYPVSTWINHVVNDDEGARSPWSLPRFRVGRSLSAYARYGIGHAISDKPKIAISTSTVRAKKGLARLSLYIWL